MLILLWLNSPAIAVRQVAQRAAEGGHGIPHEVIVRRYWAGLRNRGGLHRPLADTARIYDNSDGTGLLVAHKVRDAALVIHDRMRWASMKERDA